MSTIWRGLLEYWRENRTVDRYTHLQLEMFVANPRAPHKAFPKLKGRAAEVKSLGPALLHVFSTAMDMHDDQHKQIRLALKLSIDMENLMALHHDEHKFPPSAVNEMTRCALNFNRLVTSLAHFYNTRGQLLFNVTIKFHYLVHSAKRSGQLNPRYGWNYGGEDFMKKCKLLMQSCVRGLPLHMCVAKFSSKSAVVMELRMRDRRSWLQRRSP